MAAVADEVIASPSLDRPGMSARLLALLGGAVALALAAVVYVSYRQLIHYERRAIEHVPPGAELGLRIDLEQLVLFEPVRRHLLALVDRVPWTGGAAPAGSVVPRLQRLREQAGLNLGLDLREIVFARMPDGSWVLGLGGIFGSRPLLPGIERVLREEPDVHLREEQSMIILLPSGTTFAQADDGVLLVGSSAAVIGRALRASQGHAALGLDPQGAAAFAVLPSWFETLGPGHARASRSVPWLRSTARLEFGDPLELTVRIEHPPSSDPESMREVLEGWFGERTEPFVPRADWGGERAVLARAHFVETSDSLTTVSSTWQRSELEQAARSLAAWLESRWNGHGPAAQ
jgi:hypothetical protein